MIRECDTPGRTLPNWARPGNQPRQKAGSFSPDRVLEKLQEAGGGNR
jgi:hypothetical protein